MAPSTDKCVQEGSSSYPLSRNKVLLCCAYSLPITPQMLLLTVQRLNCGKGADVDSITCYVRNNFPVVVTEDEKLEDEVLRKLTICVNAGVLEECESSKLPHFKPQREIALGRLGSSHLQRFYSTVVDEIDQCPEMPSQPVLKTVALWWHQRLTRRIMDSARNLATKVAECLDAEDDRTTQTDNMVTDWVNPDVADADYIN